MTIQHRLRLAGLVALFSVAPLLEAVRLTALSNVDVWWHLRTGLWILQQHAFPHRALFSRLSGVPWIASSWAYDVMLAAAYKILGLRAIVILTMFFKAALAWIGYRLARAAGAAFWMAVVLSGVAQYVVPGLQPTGASLSVVFFGVELWLLVRSAQTGSLRPLYWMPPLFLLWANAHPQFVLGLILLVFFLLAIAAARPLRRFDFRYVGDTATSLPLAGTGVIVGLSFICTLANPYRLELMHNFWPSLYSSVSLQYVADMRAMSFRSPQDYLLMLLVMAAFLALGRRRSLDLFGTLALVAGALLAFRIQRDAWVAVLPAIAVLGRGFSRQEVCNGSETLDPVRKREWIAIIASAALLLTAFLPKNTELTGTVAKSFPVQACDFIRTQHLAQPLFNTYAWGGFLTWYLPEYPVSVDSRMDLYGEEWLTRYFQLIGGKTRLDDDPGFANAQVFLLERQSGMAKALTDIPALRGQYRLAYSDDLAAVFVRQRFSITSEDGGDPVVIDHAEALIGWKQAGEGNGVL